MIKLYYDKVNNYVVSHQFDEGEDDHTNDTNLVEIPQSLAGKFSREELILYMATYDPENQEETPTRMSEEELEGSNIDKLLAAFFKEENWRGSGDGGSGISSFVELTDTPTDLTGQEGKAILVNDDASGLEFSLIAGGETLTDEQIGEAVERWIGGTEWKGVNGSPPEASFTLVQDGLVAPVVVTITDTSVAGDNPLTSSILNFSDGRSNITMSGATQQFTINDISQTVTVTLTVTDIVGNSDVATDVATSNEVISNIPPTVRDQSFVIEVNTDLSIKLGTLLDLDGDTLTYSVTGSSDYSTGPGVNYITFNSASEGMQNMTITVDDGEDTATATVSVDVLAAGSITYPIQGDITEQIVSLGGTLIVQPYLVNPSSAGTVMWFKDYGHDDIKVNPVTGEVTWDTFGYTTAESYHVGIKCINNDGIGYITFIVHVGKTVDDLLYIGEGEVYTTWAQAYPNVSSGDTVIFRDGTYQGDDNRVGRTVAEQDNYPPSGTPIKLTSIMGETPGQTIFDDGISGVQFSLWAAGKNEASYINFGGLFFEGGSTIALNGDAGDKLNTRIDHIKVIYCGGAGEDSIPMYTRISDYILFEGCYSFGGGRYKFANNESTNCIFRRCIARYDRSDRRPEEDPKGSFIMYNTMDFRIDNCISIDDVDKFVNNGYKAGSFGVPVTVTEITAEGARGYIDQCLQLNSEQQLFQLDYQVSNGGGAADVESTNVSSYDNRAASYYMYSWSFSLFKNCTFNFIRPEYVKDYLIHNGGYNNWRGFVNCIFNNIPAATGATNLCSSVTVGPAAIPYNGGTSRTVEKYGILNNNIFDCLGMIIVPEDQGEQYEVGTTTVDPALRYVTRVEAGNSLSETHGATVMTLRGKSGTFWGDTGYEDDTNIPMWPFPMENTMRDKMRDYSWTGVTYSGEEYLSRVLGATDTLSGARGFCADDEDLTGYVWGYIGETVPPMGVSVAPGDAEATVMWSIPQGLHKANITGYTVSDYDPGTGAMTNGRAVAATADRITIPSLINGFDNWFVVTATDSVTGESSFSYPVYVVPNGTPTVLPQISTQPVSTSIIGGDTFMMVADVQGATTLQWKKDGVDILDALSETYTAVGSLADNGSSYTIVATNVVGSVSSTGAVLTVTALDSTAPIVSIVITGDTLDITLSDNLYTNSDIIVELLDGGTPTGDSWAGSTASIDLTLMTLPTGTRTLSVRATDPQSNVGTSDTIQYTVGSPVFTDDFSDTSNWTGNLTVANNIGLVGAGTQIGVTDWWTGATKGSVKFDLRMESEANEYEIRNIFIGCSTSGVSNGTIQIRLYKFQTSNSAVLYIDRTGASTQIGSSFQGIGGTYDFVDGQEIWQELEVSAVGTSITIKVDSVEVFSGTLPETINPLNGTMKLEPYNAGDFSIRNLIAYA